MSTKPAITVLHVSDMQFGAKHRFGSPEGTPADRQHATLAARLLTDLHHLRDHYDLAPDLIIASGDLAEQAKPCLAATDSPTSTLGRRTANSGGQLASARSAPANSIRTIPSSGGFHSVRH